jgi:hypothetical protein
MAELDLADAEAVLSALAGRGVPYVVVGSLARRWLSPEAPAPRDVDILDLLHDKGGPMRPLTRDWFTPL